jgi:hypothetical protein
MPIPCPASSDGVQAGTPGGADVRRVSGPEQSSGFPCQVNVVAGTVIDAHIEYDASTDQLISRGARGAVGLGPIGSSPYFGAHTVAQSPANVLARTGPSSTMGARSVEYYLWCMGQGALFVRLNNLRTYAPLVGAEALIWEHTVPWGAWMDSQSQSAHRPTAGIGSDRRMYVSKTVYLGTPTAVHVAIRVTAHCVVQWCDGFRVQATDYAPLGRPREAWPGREGALPADPVARHAALEELFDWLERTRGRPDPSVSLFDGSRGVLILDGVHFLLVLTPSQFADVQRCWEGHGLPRDLCYPAEEDTEAVDPLPWAGDPAAARRQFLAACGQFLGAVSRRHLELLDPGAEPDEAERDEAERQLVETLDAALGAAVLHAARAVRWWEAAGEE